jgi:hypothetical protein
MNSSQSVVVADNRGQFIEKKSVISENYMAAALPTFKFSFVAAEYKH